jgi:hypothetical protein
MPRRRSWRSLRWLHALKGGRPKLAARRKSLREGRRNAGPLPPGTRRARYFECPGKTARNLSLASEGRAAWATSVSEISVLGTFFGGEPGKSLPPALTGMTRRLLLVALILVFLLWLVEHAGQVAALVKHAGQVLLSGVN